MRRFILIASCLLMHGYGSALAQTNWPAFRGGAAAGTSAEKGLPDTWSTTQNVVWKAEVPGRGWSSPIVWGDRIFITSFISETRAPVPNMGHYLQQIKPPTGTCRWTVYCFDFKTGKMLWEKVAQEGPQSIERHIKNSYASETPVTDGKQLYAYFGNVGVFCYNLDGKELWSKKWPAATTSHNWGTGSSPALYKERLIIQNDNEEKSFLVALDTRTGNELWRVERKEGTIWATPFIWEHEQRTEIVTSGKVIRSYDLDGKQLWQMGGMTSPLIIPTPFARHNLLYVGAGYSGTKPVFAIRPGASGDISLGAAESSDQVAWMRKGASTYHPSPVVWGDYFYNMDDHGGLFTCLDARTGKPIYERRRIGGFYTASLWAYEDKIFALQEDGTTVALQAGPDLKVLRKNSLDEFTMATPAIARKSLIVRTLTKLYRIEQP
jgi:outer membrane protein assembly factor BamB